MKELKLKKIIDKEINKLIREAEIRDELVKISRDIIKLSKEIIINVQLDNYENVVNIIDELKEKVKEFTNKAKEYMNLYYSGLVRDTLAEFVEAIQFYNLMKNGEYVPIESMKVEISSYILGLLDVIGELRRSFLEALRKDDYKKAEKALTLMEDIYLSLCFHNIPDAILPGYRRKCDIARQIIERSKSDLIYAKFVVKFQNKLEGNL